MSAQETIDQLIDVARDYVRSEVRVSVKTNLTPEFKIWDGGLKDKQSGGGGSSGGGFSLSKLIGLKAAVIVRNARGETVATYGTPPPVDPVRLVIALTLLAGLGLVLVRGLTK